jgi:hypothetical protein
MAVASYDVVEHAMPTVELQGLSLESRSNFECKHLSNDEVIEMPETVPASTV